MSIAKKQDAKKWINTSVALLCIFLGYVSLSFLQTLGEWFDLEATISNFQWLSQGLSIAIGLIAFLVITRRRDTSEFLNEVFNETLKVAWPNREQTFRMTIGIMIGVSIAGAIFWIFDLTANFLLNLIR